ncbi:MAG: sigma-70 family RNA polymerase sigma factor [Kiritimatiellaeota bacterium]|nr:sigma-70 family RNA polymerase sigma factor [Kiritimatiellota bacterium]
MPEPVQPPADADDFALMARAASGDTAAFADLIRRHQNALVNFFRRLGAHNEAEDVAQETFLRVWRYRTRYRPTAKFTTFLFTLARHAWADHLRRAQKQERVVEHVGAEAVPHDATAQDAARQRLDAQVALAALPEKMRLVVVMSLYQGLKYEEIGAVLGVPVGTVKSRMFLAMARLKDVFDVKE